MGIVGNVAVAVLLVPWLLDDEGRAGDPDPMAGELRRRDELMRGLAGRLLELSRAATCGDRGGALEDTLCVSY